MSKFASGKIYTGSTLVVLEFTQAGSLGIYPAVCASKRSNDLAFITTPNVRSWHIQVNQDKFEALKTRL